MKFLITLLFLWSESHAGSQERSDSLRHELHPQLGSEEQISPFGEIWLEKHNNTVVTISQDKTPQQILSKGESCIYPRRVQQGLWSYGQDLPMSCQIIDFISLTFGLTQMVSKFFSPHFGSSQITLKNLTNQEVATFTYGDWLSKLKNANGSLVCEMPAVINEEQMMEDTTYTLQVKTSDIGGWSLTDIL